MKQSYYTIIDLTNNKPIIWKQTQYKHEHQNKIICLPYPTQCQQIINKQFNNSKRYTITKIKQK